MKKILSVLLLGVMFFTTAFNRPALAADTANAAKIFAANCAACHMGGRNVVMAAKTLQKEEIWGCGFASPHIFQDRSPRKIQYELPRGNCQSSTQWQKCHACF